MGFEKVERSRQQATLAGPIPKLIWGQSGEVEEPPGASFVVERRGQCGKGKLLRIAGRVICGVA